MNAPNYFASLEQYTQTCNDLLFSILTSNADEFVTPCECGDDECIAQGGYGPVLSSFILSLNWSLPFTEKLHPLLAVNALLRHWVISISSLSPPPPLPVQEEIAVFFAALFSNAGPTFGTFFGDVEHPYSSLPPLEENPRAHLAALEGKGGEVDAAARRFGPRIAPSTSPLSWPRTDVAADYPTLLTTLLDNGNATHFTWKE